MSNKNDGEDITLEYEPVQLLKLTLLSRWQYRIMRNDGTTLLWVDAENPENDKKWIENVLKEIGVTSQIRGDLSSKRECFVFDENSAKLVQKSLDHAVASILSHQDWRHEMIAIVGGKPPMPFVTADISKRSSSEIAMLKKALELSHIPFQENGETLRVPGPAYLKRDELWGKEEWSEKKNLKDRENVDRNRIIKEHHKEIVRSIRWKITGAGKNAQAVAILPDDVSEERIREIYKAMVFLAISPYLPDDQISRDCLSVTGEKPVDRLEDVVICAAKGLSPHR